jgi:hypothetical protein
MSMIEAVAKAIKPLFTEAYAVIYFTPKRKIERIVSAFHDLDRAKKQYEYIKQLPEKRLKGEYKLFKIAYLINIYDYIKYEEII